MDIPGDIQGVPCRALHTAKESACVTRARPARRGVAALEPPRLRGIRDLVRLVLAEGRRVSFRRDGADWVWTWRCKYLRVQVLRATQQYPRQRRYSIFVWLRERMWPATLRGRLTGERSDITCTSFALGHVLACAGNGGMLCLDDEKLRDRGLVLRRWGRTSELQMFGSRRDEKGRYLEEVDGVEYDTFFAFEDVGYNFEPSEIDAAFGLVQLDRLPGANQNG